MWRFSILALFPLLLFGQSNSAPGNQSPTPKDVTRGQLDSKNSLPPVSVPRGYALIVGISTYQKIDDASQLQFPETDAEAIYRVLISKEGGAFPADNVHRLIGRDASLANIRHELEEWL